MGSAGKVLLLAAAVLTAATAPSQAGSRETRPRSPLEQSPGYRPPADPESLSVVTGRRKARAVDLPLVGGAKSLEDLARMLLGGLEARDERALHARRLTRVEFEVICWPEFPESRPITRITAADAWGLSDPTSAKGASRAISTHGGRPLALVRVRAASRERFRNFTLHRGFVIEAREESGEIVALPFAPSVVERKGRYKVLMYKD